MAEYGERRMPRFRIHLINSEFESFEEGEYPSVDAAARSATGSAMQVAAESIATGEKTAAVEVRIEQDGRLIAHEVVNVSVSPLLSDESTSSS